MTVAVLPPVTLTLVLLLAAVAAAVEPPRDSYVIPDDAALLRQLDLERPELAAVRAALQAGDTGAAAEAYLRHFRAKQIVSPLLTDWRERERDAGYDTSRADEFLAGHLNDGYSVYEVPPEGLNWRDSPLSCSTRFPLLPPVYWAYHHTRDPSYARWAADHILGFIAAFPMSEYVGHNSREGWTSHTVVAKPWYWCMVPERLHELAQAVNLLRDCPEVTDEELLVLLRRLLEEAGYCRQEIALWVVELKHNGGCAMIESLAMACAVLDDFRPVHEYMAHDADMALSYLTEAFYPDGMCRELTVAYSLGCSVTAQAFSYALRDQPAIAAQRERVAALVDCLVGLSEPGGDMPAFGDLYPSSLDYGVYDPALEWLGVPWAGSVSRRTPGPPPPFRNWPRIGQEQWCGYYAMRSDWGPDARYLCIDGGPWGSTHQHADRLSFVLTAYGQRLIIDPSSTCYASNQPAAFISVQKAGFLHNGITVDGVDEFIEGSGVPLEAKEPLQNLWEEGSDYSLFAASHHFRPVKPVNWERRVLFAGGQYWVLQDVLKGELDHVALEQNFQFEADTRIEFDSLRAVATAPNGVRLLLVPLDGGLEPQLTIGDREPHTTYWPSGTPTTVLAREDGMDQKHGRGWTGRSGLKLLPAPAVTYVGRVSLPTTLTVALVPLPADGGLNSLPAITREVRRDDTVWALPLPQGGVLRWKTSLSGCEVLP